MTRDQQVTLYELNQIAFCFELTRTERFFLIMYLLIYGFQEIQATRTEIAVEMQMEMQAAKINMKRLKIKGIFEIKSHARNGISIKAIRGSWNRIKHRR